MGLVSCLRKPEITNKLRTMVYVHSNTIYLWVRDVAHGEGLPKVKEEPIEERQGPGLLEVEESMVDSRASAPKARQQLSDYLYNFFNHLEVSPTRSPSRHFR